MNRERTGRPEEAQPVKRAVQPAGPPPAISPINWWKLDQDERKETLETLTLFVPELARRYALSDAVIPPCWYRHEALIQELLALYQYRNQNQFLNTSPATAPKEWHYELQIAMMRLRSWVTVTGCNIGEHYEDQPQKWSIPGESACALWQTEIEDFITGQLPDLWHVKTPGGTPATDAKETENVA